MNNENDIKPGSSGNKKAKRVIIIVISALLLCIALMYALSTLLENACASSPFNNGNSTNEEYEFYTPDFMANIYKDNDYMQLDRTVRYNDKPHMTCIGLLPEKINTQPEHVQFMCRFINNIIGGDHIAYNSMFSSAYYTKANEKGRFTMQRLYDIELTLESMSEVNEGGMTYDKYVYSLNYCIQRNDGTYRDDMPSDCSKTQIITVTNREGKLLIDSIITKNYVR